MKNLKTRRGTSIQKLPKGSYRYRAVVRGKQYYFPLGIVKSEACDRADAIKDRLKFDDIHTVRRDFHPAHMLKKMPTIGNIIQAHEELEASLGLAESTAKAYRQGLRHLIRLGLGVSARHVDSVEVHQVNSELVQRAKSTYINARKGNSEAAKRSFNSILSMARGIFSRESRAAMENMGHGWDFKFMRDGFLEAVPFKRVRKKWVCMRPEEIQELVWKIENMAGGELYTIMALALYAGMRRAEITAMEFDWVREQSPSGENDVQIIITKTHNFKPKGRMGYTILNKKIWQRIVDRRNVFGSGLIKCQTSRAVTNKVKKFLRETCGIDVQKPLHELRKLAGAYFTNRHGMWLAQKYLRHEDPKTTADYYSDCVLPENTLELWER